MVIRMAAEQAAKAWERGKGRKAERKRGKGSRSLEAFDLVSSSWLLSPVVKDVGAAVYSCSPLCCCH